MRIYKCDNCGKEFTQALDFEEYKDEHGVWHVIDLCAECRKNINIQKENNIKETLSNIVKKTSKAK